MTTREILTAARERIATPERWLKGDYRALDAAGNQVAPYSPQAARWSTSAAVMSFVPVPEMAKMQAGHTETSALLRAALGTHPDRFNGTHDEVLAAFGRAIAACGGTP